MGLRRDDLQHLIAQQRADFAYQPALRLQSIGRIRDEASEHVEASISREEGQVRLMLDDISRQFVDLSPSNVRRIRNDVVEPVVVRQGCEQIAFHEGDAFGDAVFLRVVCARPEWPRRSRPIAVTCALW